MSFHQRRFFDHLRKQRNLWFFVLSFFQRDLIMSPRYQYLYTNSQKGPVTTSFHNQFQSHVTFFLGEENYNVHLTLDRNI